MPKQVQDAMDSADNDCGLELRYLTRDEWQTIRAELHRLTEIAEGVELLVIRLGEVTTQLEAICATLPGVTYMDQPDGGNVSRVEQFRRMAKDAATEREIQNAADKLPEGFVITLYVEQGSGYIDMTGPDGDPVYVNTSDLSIAEQFAEATRAAIQSHLQGAGDEA